MVSFDLDSQRARGGFRLGIVCCLIFGASALTRSQSIYVDMDIMIGGPAIGAGTPSTLFGAAAGVPGYWNQVPTGNGGPRSLRDTLGAVTNVSMSWTGSGGGLGYNNPNISGDFKQLMADADPVGAGGLRYTISGLTDGSYRVFTYACKPQGEAWTTMITVTGSTSPNPQAVTGPMPVNQFILGVTHSMHDVDVSGGMLTIYVAEHQNSYVNGFQILAVPEASTWISLCIGVLAVAFWRWK